jgi:diguanylate cyclase (GGDEF)-like protein
MRNSNISFWSPDSADSERLWRLDAVEAYPSGGEEDTAIERETVSTAEATVARTERAERRRVTFRYISRWHRKVRAWLHARRTKWFGICRRRFEEVFSRFASELESAGTLALVETALLQAARAVVPECQLELCNGNSTDLADDIPGAGDHRRGRQVPRRWMGWQAGSVLELPLCYGGNDPGCLRIQSSGAGSATLDGEWVRRMSTICAMARLAMRNLHADVDWPGDVDDGSELGVADSIDAARNVIGRVRDPRPRAELRDATFLNAVLPFALTQARRYREPLSIACVEIDRLSGIQDLLGRGTADRLVWQAGEIIAGMVRRSDVVVRLDDDRIVAVLLRASGDDALRVAREICKAVPKRCRIIWEKSEVVATVSIGVATFPAGAIDLYSLVGAAEDALALAQGRGRDRAVLAPTRATCGPASVTGSPAFPPIASAGATVSASGA